MASTTNAISNNDRLFPLFKKRLAADDLDTFVSSAQKFAEWLRSDKAYYASARPQVNTKFNALLYHNTHSITCKIVDLLEACCPSRFSTPM
jgi:hypothetical protein